MTKDVLEAKINEARKIGVAKVEDPNGTYMIVVPQTRGAAAPEPFNADVQHLLQMPKARPAYSDRTAWLMAELSQLAYHQFEKHSEMHSLLCESLSDAGFTLHATIDEKDTGTQCFIALRSREFAVLAFRGTEKNLKDIITDLKARFYDTPDGKAHEGFQKAYNSSQRSIKQTLSRLPADLPLYICGHSLGGALATVAAQNLEETHPVAAVYTFGSPKVGVPEWSDSIKTPVYRIVNGADLVPIVPFGVAVKAAVLWISKMIPVAAIQRFVKEGFVGFQHAGDIRFLGGSIQNPKLKIGTAAGHRRVASLCIWLLWYVVRQRTKGTATKGIADHSVTRYATKLRVIAQQRNPNNSARSA